MSTTLHHRFALLAAGTALACTGPLLTAPTAHAAPPTTPCATGTPVPGDHDGDGRPDLVVKVWNNAVDESVLFVSPDRTTHGTWLDVEGSELQSADLNGDTCADAIVVEPQRSITLVLGTPSGLDTAAARQLALPQSAGLGLFDRVLFKTVGFHHDGVTQVVVAGHTWVDADRVHRDPFVDVFTLDPTGAPGTPQVIDARSFASGAQGLSSWPTAIAADSTTLVIGNGGDTVSGKSGAGRVHVFTPDGADPTRLVHRAAISQASPGVAGSPQKADWFGGAVALRDGRLAIGAQGESIGKATATGRVQLMRWNATKAAFTAVKAIDQGTKGVPGTNEKKDRFGSVLTIARGLTAAGSYDVVVGTPNETVGNARYAGSVTIGSFTKATYRTYTQNTKGVPDKVEKAPSEASAYGEYFGWAVGVLATSPTTDTLAIGAPGETNGRCLSQGYVVLTDGKKLGSSTKWTYLAPPTTGCSIYDEDVFDGWGAGFGVGSPALAELP